MYRLFKDFHGHSPHWGGGLLRNSPKNRFIIERFAYRHQHHEVFAAARDDSGVGSHGKGRPQLRNEWGRGEQLGKEQELGGHKVIPISPPISPSRGEGAEESGNGRPIHLGVSGGVLAPVVSGGGEGRGPDPSWGSGRWST